MILFQLLTSLGCGVSHPLHTFTPFLHPPINFPCPILFPYPLYPPFHNLHPIPASPLTLPTTLQNSLPYTSTFYYPLSYFHLFLSPLRPTRGFACSPRVCVGLLQVLWFPPTLKRHAQQLALKKN